MDNKYDITTIRLFDSARLVMIYGSIRCYPVDYSTMWNTRQEDRKILQMGQGVHDHA